MQFCFICYNFTSAGSTASQRSRALVTEMSNSESSLEKRVSQLTAAGISNDDRKQFLICLFFVVFGSIVSSSMERNDI